MKKTVLTMLSALLLSLPVAGMAGDDGKDSLCTAKDVQRNIDQLRASIEELQATHDAQRGMDMLHEHMAIIIDNQQIILGLLDKGARKGVECPKRLHEHKKTK